MYKKTLVSTFLVYFVCGILSMVNAQVDERTFNELESSGAPIIGNPFKTQIPVVVEDPSLYPPEEEETDPIEKMIEETPPEPEPPPPPPPRPAPVLNINGIIWNTDRPQAIIDRRVINVGDVIAEVHITAISPSGIEGMFDGRTIILPYRGLKNKGVENE